MTATSSRQRGRGRPSEPTGARQAILDAALHQFAEHGYQGASIRAIAAEAGVESSLIGHHFGPKRQLFATVITEGVHLGSRIQPSLQGDRTTIGERFTRTYLSMWEDPGVRPLLSAIVRSAMSESGNFTDMLRDVQHTILHAELDVDALTEQGYSPDGVELSAVILLGVAAGRHIIDLPPVNSLDLEALIDTLTPTIQNLITEGTR